MIGGDCESILVLDAVKNQEKGNRKGNDRYRSESGDELQDSAIEVKGFEVQWNPAMLDYQFGDRILRKR